MFKYLYLLTCFSIYWIFPLSSKPKQTGSITGKVKYKNQDLINVVVEMKGDYKANINKYDDSFYIGDVRTGPRSLVLNIYDPIHGNFRKKLTDINVEYFKILDLGNIVIEDADKVVRSPIYHNGDLRKKIVIDDFPLDSDDLFQITKDKSRFFAKAYWQDVLGIFAENCYRYYNDIPPLERKNFIFIIGHTSSIEMNNDRQKQIKLGLDRAFAVFNFILDNFELPQEAFLITSKGPDELIKKKKLKSLRNRRVELLFDNPYYY